MSAQETFANQSDAVEERQEKLQPAEPGFRHRKVRGTRDRKVDDFDEAKLKELQQLRGAERYQKMAQYILEQCRIIRTDGEIDKLLTDVNNRSADTENPAKTAKEIEKLTEQDRGTQLVLKVLPRAAWMAALYQQGENYSKRQTLLKATAEYDDILPIRRIGMLFRNSVIGPADHRGLGDTIRLVVAEVEGKDEMPEPPSRINAVE
jgi:hypothetical protein